MMHDEKKEDTNLAFYHGIKTSQQETSVSTPVEAGSGIPFVVGTAPVHTVGGAVNKPVLAMNYKEAVEALGYSDDWGKYTLCEMMYSHFRLYQMSPVIFVNVLDPNKEEHVEEKEDEQVTVTDKKASLPFEAVLDTLEVKQDAEGEALVADTDYLAYYEEDRLTIELISEKTAQAAQLYVSYTKMKPDGVTKEDIIGGYDAQKKVTTGLELIDESYARFSIIPDLILAPGFSHHAGVAAMMAQKAEKQCELFEGMALIDVDVSATGARHYSDVLQWKNKNNLTSKYQTLCYPMVEMDGRRFHLSVQLAGLMAKVDTDNDGCPSESPSNKDLEITGLCDADGNEIVLTLPQANYLNSIGVATASNFQGGFRFWGNETACYPSNTDIKDYYICVSRTFAWVANSIVLTFWNKVDRKINRLLLDNIVDSCNMWMNSLVAENKLLAGRVECHEDENSTIDLMAGRLKFHVYLTSPIPAREIEFVLEYDVNRLADIFAGQIA